MKKLPGLFALFIISNCLGQIVSPNQLKVSTQRDTASPGVIFLEDFNNNRKNWTVADNRKVSAKINGGFYYLSAVGHAYGEAQEVKIDTRKDFDIETRIKIISGGSGHKDYYSMLFWGREAMNGYYFTFAKDGFVSIEVCNGKNQRDCVTKKGSLQKKLLDPDGFNLYLIRKTGSTYTFFVNGTQLFTMPFSPFFGNLIGFGAGRKVSLAIDYLKVTYL